MQHVKCLWYNKIMIGNTYKRLENELNRIFTGNTEVGPFAGLAGALQGIFLSPISEEKKAKLLTDFLLSLSSGYKHRQLEYLTPSQYGRLKEVSKDKSTIIRWIKTGKIKNYITYYKGDYKDAKVEQYLIVAEY